MFNRIKKQLVNAREYAIQIGFTIGGAAVGLIVAGIISANDEEPIKEEIEPVE